MDALNMGAYYMRLLCAAVLLLLLVSGCGYTPAADTTLTLSEGNDAAAEEIPVGFTEAFYDDSDGRIVIVGHGWMPSEHENRVYAWNEQFQPVRSRWFRLVSPPPVDDEVRVWTIELVVDPMLPRTGYSSETLVRNDIYTGSFSVGHNFRGKALALDFPNIRLTNVKDSERTILVSGHIAAKRASHGELSEMRESFELAMDFR